VGELVALPLWLIAGLGVLAAVALTDRLVLPLGRRFLAGRRERAVEALNDRLALPIAPYKLAGRRALVSQLMLDPVVQTAIATEAQASGKPIAKVEQQAARYAREIVPTFSAGLYFRVGTRLARKLSKALYRVRVGAGDTVALQGVPAGSAVVFVINHRSNMDYVLVTYLASRSSALSYAVGEWARVPGLSGLIRLMGAYFIRRGSGNVLYRRVLARYVHIATASGVTQAMFPEGGLSRDGRLQPAKLGLLGYMVGDFDPAAGRDIVFVPVGLNYDRVLEDRVLLAAGADIAAGQRPRFAFRLTTFLRFVTRMVFGRLFGRWYRNGYACVSFGAPVSLRAYLAERTLDFRPLDDATRNARIAELGATLMQRVGLAVPALPVSLVALAFVRAGGRALTTLELSLAVARQVEDLRAAGGSVYMPRANEDYTIDVGLRMLTLRRIIIDDGGLLRIADGEEPLLRYYANALAHLVPVGERIVTSATVTPSTSVPVGAAAARPGS
jgi:glycerol-3-phosphate O-acyltransferase